MLHEDLLCGALPAATGCGVDCTANAASSVDVLGVDDQGATVPDAVVTFSGAEQPAECLLAGAGNGCEKWVAGRELTGTIVVTASVPGGGQGAATADVTADECHVMTQNVTITIQ